MSEEEKYKLCVLGAIICGGLAIGLFIGLATTPKEYSFFVAGHTYGDPQVEDFILHPPFRNLFSYLKKNTDFGVLTGDFVKAPKDFDVFDKQIKDLDVYLVAGNHDLKDREEYERRYGKTWYSFKKHDDLFIVLDGTIAEWNIVGEQLVFLKKALEQKADNIFIFVHQMIWWHPNWLGRNVTPNSFEGSGAIDENEDTEDKIIKIPLKNFWSEIYPLLLSTPNDVYIFAGDFGASDKVSSGFMVKNHNTTFVGSGMGGSKDDNVVIVDVGKKVELRFLGLKEHENHD